MIIAIFVRRLRPAVTFEDFRLAWMASPGHFGRTVRVTHAQRIDDDREIISYATMNMTRAEFLDALTRVAPGERGRHDRIDDVIESTIHKGFYEVTDVTDLS